MPQPPLGGRQADPEPRAAPGSRDDDTAVVDALAADDGRGTVRYFDEAARGWIDRYARRASFRHRLRAVADLVEPILAAHHAPLVLDFGGGPGIVSMLCARAGGHVVDLDASPGMIRAGRHASRRIATMVDAVAPPRPTAAAPTPPRPAALPGLPGLPGLAEPAGTPEQRAPSGTASTGEPAGPTPGTVRFVAGSLDALGPAARGRFDLVLAIAVLEYVEDAHATLARLGELLAPDGTLVLTVPDARAPLRRAERRLAPALSRASRATTARRVRDRAYTDLRPHGDAVPWRSAAVTARLTVDAAWPLALGDRAPWSWARPNTIVRLRHAAAPAPAGLPASVPRPAPTPDHRGPAPRQEDPCPVDAAAAFSRNG